MRIPAFLGTALAAGLVAASPAAAQSGPPPSSYQRPIPGARVDPYWVAREYYIGTWQSHGWPAPPRGYAWSRYYDDAVLIDGNGTVYDVRYAVVWTKDDPKAPAMATAPAKDGRATGSQAADRDDAVPAGNPGTSDDAADRRRGRPGADFPPPPPAPVPPDPGPPPPPFVPSSARSPSPSPVAHQTPQSPLPTVTVSRPPVPPGMPEPPPPKITVSQQPGAPGPNGAQTVTTITIEPQPVTTQTEVEVEEAAPEE